MDLFKEQQNDLVAAAERIADELVDKGLAERKVYTDERTANQYSILTTPAAFDKDLVVVTALGHPERVGVWSYTLLAAGREEETTMAPYFKAFADLGIGFIAIDPNFPKPDDDSGQTFVYQLDKVISEIKPPTRIGLIGFSMGGRILVEFLEERKELIGRVAALALIDPSPPSRIRTENIRDLLDNNTLLIASITDDHSPGDIASALLEIDKISYKGIHGQMPNKSLTEVLKFFEKRNG